MQFRFCVPPGLNELIIRPLLDSIANAAWSYYLTSLVPLGKLFQLARCFLLLPPTRFKSPQILFLPFHCFKNTEKHAGRICILGP